MEREDIPPLPNYCPKMKCIIKWMTNEERPYELHDDFLATLTRDSYLKFRHLDTQSFSSSPSSHHEPFKFKTSSQGEFKHPTTSESQTALNNFKKGTKRDASVYPIFKNDKISEMVSTYSQFFILLLSALPLRCKKLITLICFRFLICSLNRVSIPTEFLWGLRCFHKWRYRSQ